MEDLAKSLDTVGSIVVWLLVGFGAMYALGAAVLGWMMIRLDCKMASQIPGCFGRALEEHEKKPSAKPSRLKVWLVSLLLFPFIVGCSFPIPKELAPRVHAKCQTCAEALYGDKGRSGEVCEADKQAFQVVMSCLGTRNGPDCAHAIVTCVEASK